MKTSVKFNVLPDGDLLLPSAFKALDGKPRFSVPIPQQLGETDAGLRVMLHDEMLRGGFEAQTRRFFDSHLKPGDTFLDVGAHWGIFSLTVASGLAGGRKVVAIEPDPFNVQRLSKAVTHNGLQRTVEIVACAMGSGPGVASLVGGRGTMGHSVDGASFRSEKFATAPPPSYSVPVLSIDSLLAMRPDLIGERIFLKIDAEGYDIEVLAGARDLIASGRLAAAMIEKGEVYDAEPHFSRFGSALDGLRDKGYRLYRFKDRHRPGPLSEYALSDDRCDVLALGPGVKPLRRYG